MPQTGDIDELSAEDGTDQTLAVAARSMRKERLFWPEILVLIAYVQRPFFKGPCL